MAVQVMVVGPTPFRAGVTVDVDVVDVTVEGGVAACTAASAVDVIPTRSRMQALRTEATIA